MENDTYNVIIVEDMPKARDLLVKYCDAIPQLKTPDIAEDGREALLKLKSQKYDIVFLDVNLPVISGIDVLSNIENLPHIIFTTAFDEYAIKAFEYGAIDYLLKPISYNRFSKSIDRFLQMSNASGANSFHINDHSFAFKENRKQCLVAYKDIIYLSSSGRKTVIHTNDKDFETAMLIKEIEDKLPSNFFRIHKQYIVNLLYIVKIEHDSGWQYKVILNNEDETVLPVGKKNVEKLKDVINS